MMYTEDQMLLLSGLQHFAFCRRQWALIHIEQQWEENERTAAGEILHERTHDEFFTESRGDLIVTRGVRISSASLGVTGACDVVEFHRSPDGVALFGREGTWQPLPVEYKRGESKEGDEDRLQLCGQAMCLEEMLCCEIPVGCLYYGKTRHRETVTLDSELRDTVRSMLQEMHQYYERRYTPKVKPQKKCSACSLKDRCMPKLCRNVSAHGYLQKYMEEME